MLYAVGAFDSSKAEPREYQPPSYCHLKTDDECNALIHQHNKDLGIGFLGFVLLLVVAFIVENRRTS